MTNTFETDGVRIAVEGCGHGTLDAIYASVATSCRARGWDGVDLLIIGGDFQSTRNAADLTVMSVPPKYRAMGDFHAYYAGTRVAPYLTVFVGGNHEAAAYLWELFYGGWVAPRIYYWGAANVLRLGPLRLAGLSGIWKGFDYRRPHHERLPFSQDDVKSFYHVREIDVRRLLQLREPVDVGISHDWPRAIETHGDAARLFRMKPMFRSESADGTLGNPAAQYVMDRLRPSYWFSAHLHCKFAAVKQYDPPEATEPSAMDGAADAAAEPSSSTGNIVLPPVRSHTASEEATTAAEPTENPDEIVLDVDEEDDAVVPVAQSTDAERDPADDNNTEPVISNVDGVSNELMARLPASFSRPSAQQGQWSGQQPQKRLPPGQPVPPTINNTTVRFLALDKCMPGRHFLQLCEISPLGGSVSVVDDTKAPEVKDEKTAEEAPTADADTPADAKEKNEETIEETPSTDAAQTSTDACRDTQAGGGDEDNAFPAPYVGRFHLSYDPEWLAITRVFAPDISIGDPTRPMVPADRGEAAYRPRIDAERAWVEANIVSRGRLAVPVDGFVRTAPVHVPAIPGRPETFAANSGQPDEYTNPQTAAFCALVGIPNLWDAPADERAERKAQGPAASAAFSGNRRGGQRSGSGSGGGSEPFFGGGGGGGYHGHGGRGRGGRGGRGRGRGRGRW